MVESFEVGHKSEAGNGDPAKDVRCKPRPGAIIGFGESDPCLLPQILALAGKALRIKAQELVENHVGRILDISQAVFLSVVLKAAACWEHIEQLLSLCISSLVWSPDPCAYAPITAGNLGILQRWWPDVPQDLRIP